MEEHGRFEREAVCLHFEVGLYKLTFGKVTAFKPVGKEEFCIDIYACKRLDSAFAAIESDFDRIGIAAEEGTDIHAFKRAENKFVYCAREAAFAVAVIESILAFIVELSAKLCYKAFSLRNRYAYIERGYIFHAAFQGKILTRAESYRQIADNNFKLIFADVYIAFKNHGQKVGMQAVYKVREQIANSALFILRIEY